MDKPPFQKLRTHFRVLNSVVTIKIKGFQKPVEKISKLPSLEITAHISVDTCVALWETHTPRIISYEQEQISCHV